MADQDEKLILELERLNVALGAVKDAFDNASTATKIRDAMDDAGDTVKALKTVLLADGRVSDPMAAVVRVNRELKAQLDAVREIVAKAGVSKQGMDGKRYEAKCIIHEPKGDGKPGSQYWYVECPDFDIQTQGESKEDAAAMIADASESLLGDGHLVGCGKVTPREGYEGQFICWMQLSMDDAVELLKRKKDADADGKDWKDNGVRVDEDDVSDEYGPEWGGDG